MALLGSMTITIQVRALSDEEAHELARRARSLGAALVRRAQIVQHAVADGLSALEVAAKMGLCGATVRFWLKRFNARGLRPTRPRSAAR